MSLLATFLDEILVHCNFAYPAKVNMIILTYSAWKIKILDLGCGKKKRPNSIGVDFSDRHDADIIHDLNTFPYPFDSSSIDEVFMDNVLEHLDDPNRVMEEVYRITKKNAK